MIERYFNSERAESLFFIIIGIVAIVLSGYFLIKIKQPFYNGTAIAFTLIALIQLTVGSSVYFRSPKDIERVNSMLREKPHQIEQEEIPRMKTVMRNFVLYRWIEITLLLLGIALLAFTISGSMWKGFGLGLLVQSAIMLLLDYFAESRGEAYLDYLLKMVK